MVVIAGYEVDKYILPPTVTHRNRARSVVYALDGTAKEDRLGSSKKMLTLPFALLPASVWENLRTALQELEITVSGNVGRCTVSGKYRMYGNDLPTPVLYVDNGSYICQPFSVTLEEI
ncbi:MAG: hypothetical protein IJ784_00250 [Ruminiclostridium sp.]|nr:hypothetical protein [Ruminiclostridium sp.]